MYGNININQINKNILSASEKMEKCDFSSAVEQINKTLQIDKNNYELIFMLALCYEQMGNIEKSYYTYKLAIYLADGTEDKEVIEAEFKRLCSYADADEYKLGKALESIIIDRINTGEISNTYKFLTEMFNDNNKVAAMTAITEENMLLFMMLEINSCENNNIIEDDNNVFNIYGCDYEKFRQVYIQLKFIFRRIWFGFDIKYQNELSEIVKKYNVSSDMVAVIAKYSIDKPCWVDAFGRISYIFEQAGLYSHANRINQYKEWLLSIGEGNTEMCKKPDTFNNKTEIKIVNCKNRTCNELVKNKTDETKIAVIYCTNDELYDRECILYLKRLRIPEGMDLEINPVINAPGMAAGYNAAMSYSDAKYKIYIHHDTFITDTDLLSKLIEIFNNNLDIGLIGNFGTTKLLPSGRWYENESVNNRGNLYQDEMLNIKHAVSIVKEGNFEYADAIDGIFMAASKDLRWREDLFDGWHFYDISQTFEFRKAGYKTVFMNDYENTVALIHETTARKDPYNLYDKYRKIFLENYMLDVNVNMK